MIEPQIMYIELKPDGVSGTARIGRVSFTKSGRGLYYQGRLYLKQKGGFKTNYFDAETGEAVWISGCKESGGDRLYSGSIEIDDDVREEYWIEIRKMPDRKNERVIRDVGKYHPRAK